jgi:hypothetical protein
LEDLIKFKVATVADKLRENNQGYEGSGIEIISKLCDPLLANKHYPSLVKRAYPILNNKKNNLSYNNLENTS